ncbi:hypothetical protein [Deinococcus hopiensis]|uniref:Uncharacterized protein n=1 Tax=Deinococcus hopiensis KR-140 TaxID=695939 RepID=A0A1W1VDT9_9DEIO|nr:hypothetical protein [Deinococcus hopiensis]SMB91542.1 hypothetical protein SAMN00790413_01179 [Deinococcus hopiensis KR-140]
MTSLTFGHIHLGVAAAFPELARPPALLCEDEICSTDGAPSQYIGTRLLLLSCLEVLLALPTGPHGDAALKRAFAFTKRMLVSPDDQPTSLAEIELTGGQPAWWFQRAQPFAGCAEGAASRAPLGGTRAPHPA